MGDFGRELEAWLGQVERALLLQDPAEALALAEAFIQTDEVFFNRADDSGGVIGDAIRAGCVLWLRAASGCESPAGACSERICTLVAADQYGARKSVLRHADLLLSEALRDLDALVRAMLRRCPAPCPVQKASLAEAFLEYGRPEGALPWLQGSWEHLEITRE